MRHLVKTPAKLSKEEYISALEKMKKSPRNRIGILGKLGATGLGAVAGGGVAGFFAGIFGATTLFGSTLLASVFGGVFLVSTPIGWVIGFAILGALIAFGIAKVVDYGGKADAISEMNMSEIEARISELEAEANQFGRKNPKYRKLIDALELLLLNEKISQEDSTDLLAAIETSTMTVDFAFETIHKMLEEEMAKENLLERT